MMRNDPMWHVPIRLDDVPETGRHLDLVADEAARANLVALAGLRALPRLEAAIDVVRHGNGLRASGRVSASVGQTCVVTLEPVESEVEEAFDVLFSAAAQGDRGGATQYDGDEPPEPLVDGVTDIGAVAAEFLLLGIDRYPRKPGAVFAAPVEEGGGAGPFAALAKIKKRDAR
jgi:hypothetical protein